MTQVETFIFLTFVALFVWAFVVFRIAGDLLGVSVANPSLVRLRTSWRTS